MGVADIADVGQDQHRQLLIEEMAHRVGRRFALREAHIGKRFERALDVKARRQQRLRHVGDGAGDDADGAPLPALVEELHGAGGAFAGNLDARDIVAKLDRQIEARLGLAIRRLEGERRFAERQTLEIERAHRAALGRAGRGAQHFDAERAGRVIGAGQRAGARNAAGDDRDRMLADGLRQALSRNRRRDRDRRRRTARPIRRSACLDRNCDSDGSACGAVDGVGHRLDLLQPHARRIRGLQ